MSGLVGHSTHGVGADIVSYLQEAARFFNATIHVTSAYRSPDEQAVAMLDNWVKLKHGQVYRLQTLPVADRNTLESYFVTMHNVKASAAERAKARADFLQLAKLQVGAKSAHSTGRALDVRQSGISPQLYRAITLHLHEVKEGKRTDICHFENRSKVPTVDAAILKKWGEIKSGVIHPPALNNHAHLGVWC